MDVGSLATNVYHFVVAFGVVYFVFPQIFLGYVAILVALAAPTPPMQRLIGDDELKIGILDSVMSVFVVVSVLALCATLFFVKSVPSASIFNIAIHPLALLGVLFATVIVTRNVASRHAVERSLGEGRAVGTLWMALFVFLSWLARDHEPLRALVFSGAALGCLAVVLTNVIVLRAVLLRRRQSILIGRRIRSMVVTLSEFDRLRQIIEFLPRFVRARRSLQQFYNALSDAERLTNEGKLTEANARLDFLEFEMARVRERLRDDVLADFRLAISEQLRAQIAATRKRAQEVDHSGLQQLLERVANEADLKLAAHDTAAPTESVDDAIRASEGLQEIFTRLDQADAVTDVIEGRSERLATQEDTIIEAESFQLLSKEIDYPAPRLPESLERFQQLMQSSQDAPVDTAEQAVAIFREVEELAGDIRGQVQDIKQNLSRSYHRIKVDDGLLVFLPKVIQHEQEASAFVMADGALSRSLGTRVSIHSTKLEVDRVAVIDFSDGGRFDVAGVTLLGKGGGDSNVIVSVAGPAGTEDYRETVYLAPGVIHMMKDSGAISGLLATVLGGLLFLLGRDADMATLASVGAFVVIFLARFLLVRRRRSRMLADTGRSDADIGDLAVAT